MPKYKIILEYDGTNYVGWQKQKNGTSIQEEIERALYSLTGVNTSVFGAGRTDAGVHALGQVAHFELENDFKIDNIRDGLNQHLRPHLIAILKVELVNDLFHSRFSAKQRTYIYKIVNRRAPLTINKSKKWIVFKKLNIEKMIEESKFFLGKNDLNAFRSINCQSNTSIKTIDSIKILSNKDDLTITVSAKSFLHSQVRIMVGTLIEIGKEKIKFSIQEIINDRERSKAGITAPACGLYLLNIEY
jgi:tRNA pseudouridine38-40 synthase